MSWTETHERYRIIREVVAAAEADPTGTLPWRPEYAASFGTPEGLVEALRVLHDVPGIVTVRFNDVDVVRHPLVAEIVKAYDRYAGGGDAKGRIDV